MLFPYDVQDGFLGDEQYVLRADHVEHLIGIEALHPNDLVVTLAVVENGLGKVL